MQDITTFLSNHAALASAVAIVLFLVTIVEIMRAKKSPNQLTPAQVTQKINREHATVVDLRSNEQFRAGHIVEAVNLSAKELREDKKIDKYKSRPIVIVDQNGNDAQKIAAFLLKQGYNAYALRGGIRAWLNAELPVVKK